MRKRKKLYPYLGFGVVALIALALFVYVLDPKYSFKISNVSIPAVVVFFVLSLLTFFGIFSFVFLNKRRGILTSVFINSVLILRYFGYKNIFYAGILAAIFILTEYFFATNKFTKKKHFPREAP